MLPRDPPPVLSVAAVALREWRKRLGISQTKAAAALGVDQARYSQFERGVRKPGRTIATRIEIGTGGIVKAIDWDRLSTLPMEAKAG